MTAAFLQSELASLISDSKRKNVDVRAAAEKSLADLKAIQVTSETQLAADLIRKTNFVEPFLLACRSQNVKLAGNGAASLQRLVASTAVPRTRLADMLEAFQEAIPLAFEVQLKVLQTLPSLLQLYADDLHGQALATTLSISADLSSSKTPLVSNTASATFQQLLTSILERIPSRKGSKSSSQDERPGGKDAFAIFEDLCSLITSTGGNFADLRSLSLALVLETLENMITNYGRSLFLDVSARTACIERLIPGLSNAAANTSSFNTMVRATRILFLLVTQYFNIFKTAFKDVLTIYVSLLERSTTPRWRRIVAFEFWRAICTNFEILRLIFATYQSKESSKGLVASLMSTLVRTAAEDPTLIGLGRQSTVPSSRGDDAATNAATLDLTGAPTGLSAPSQASSTSTGVSAAWSTIPIPCLEQPDKVNAPDLPDTYVFTLVLGSIAGFSDGVSKYLMPLSVPTRRSTRAESSSEDEAANTEDSISHRRASTSKPSTSEKYQHLVNPLKRLDLTKKVEIRACADMVEACWPAILATCSTFLNAALDSYYYHMLVRTVQKLTQVSGVLELETPRDALLTTLAKVSVPANVSHLMNTIYGDKPAKVSLNIPAENVSETEDIMSPMASEARHSVDIPQTLNVRNLLCLRALLNLGIALGPTLSDTAWTIVLQALQQVEALTSVGPTGRLAAVNSGAQEGSESDAGSELGTELAAVDTARRRMLDSTRTYNESSFQTITKALFSAIDSLSLEPSEQLAETLSPNTSNPPGRPTHKASRSVSGLWTKTVILEIEVQFVLKTVGRLIFANLPRFIDEATAHDVWDTIVRRLLLLQNAQSILPRLRSQAADIVDALVVETSKGSEAGTDSVSLKVVEGYCLPALGRQLEGATKSAEDAQQAGAVEGEIYRRMIETLENLVSHQGERLEGGWLSVFHILQAIMKTKSSSVRLVSAAFRVVQLVMSDFLTALHHKSHAKLLCLLLEFVRQQADLNVSFTAIALFWNANASIFADDPRVDAVYEDQISVGKLGRELEATNGTTDVASCLWFLEASILSLCCRDQRSDVRQAAIRMLLKIADASVERMTSTALTTYVYNILLPLCESCATQGRTDTEVKVSALALIDGIAATVQDNATVYFVVPERTRTWSKMLRIMDNMLEDKDIASVKTIFGALRNILQACQTVLGESSYEADSELIEGAWKLAVECNPSAWVVGDKSNQDGLTARADVLLQITKFPHQRLADDDLLRALKETLFVAMLPPYSSDVSKLSLEQERVVGLLGVCKEAKSDDLDSYLTVLAILITDTLQESINVFCAAAAVATLASKGLVKPTRIAFLATAVGLLSETFTEYVKNNTDHEPSSAGIVLESYLKVLESKYTKLPENAQSPLWYGALSAVASMLNEIRAANPNGLTASVTDNLAPKMSTLLLGTLGVPSTEPLAQRSDEVLQRDQAFESTEFTKIHEAAMWLLNHSSVKNEVRTEYIYSLYSKSLLAQPWRNDSVLPKDISQPPSIVALSKLRPGSLRAPALPLRREIYRSALTSLYSLVDARNQTAQTISQTTPNPPPSSTPLSSIAAPYILARTAHTLNTFLADQPLRGLNPPHRALQNELATILTAFTALNVHDASFASITSPTDNTAADGKTHLRLLYPVFVCFARYWRTECPRIRQEGLRAWQDDEDGRQVSDALVRWERRIGEGWAVTGVNA